MSAAARLAVLAGFAACAWCGSAFARVDLTGSHYLYVNASCSSSTSCSCTNENIQVDKITERASTASGDMHIRVWYTPSNDFFTPGYVVADYDLGVINGNSYISGFNHTISCSAPPNGEYCVSISAEDFTANTTDDYMQFAGCSTWPPNGACSLTCTAKNGFNPTGSSGNNYSSSTKTLAVDWRSLLVLGVLAIVAFAVRARKSLS